MRLNALNCEDVRGTVTVPLRLKRFTSFASVMSPFKTGTRCGGNKYVVVGTNGETLFAF